MLHIFIKIFEHGNDPFPPVWTMLKKTALFLREGFPNRPMRTRITSIIFPPMTRELTKLTKSSYVSAVHDPESGINWKTICFVLFTNMCYDLKNGEDFRFFFYWVLANLPPAHRIFLHSITCRFALDQYWFLISISLRPKWEAIPVLHGAHFHGQYWDTSSYVVLSHWDQGNIDFYGMPENWKGSI